MSDELILARATNIDGLEMRFYTPLPDADRELPWTCLTDLLDFLRLPEHDKIQTVLQIHTPHSFRRGSDGVTAISHLAALELIEQFASPPRAEAWREAALDILIESCRAPTEIEFQENLEHAQRRSLEIAHEGFARLLATAPRH